MTNALASVALEEVIITRELDSRPAPESDHCQIKQALQELAAHMVDGPDAVLPRFVDLAMELGGGVSAGISIAELAAFPPVFRWAFLKGSLAVFEGATTPRDFSPCGVTLDTDSPVLTRHSERYYAWIADVNIIVPEILLLPLHRGAEQLGTLWIVSDKLGHFNRGHVAAITEVAAFVSIALRMHQTETRLWQALAEQETLAMEMSHRVKNVFNIVDGMIHLGAKRAATKEDLADSLSGRVRALAVAHGMIRRTFTDGSVPVRATEMSGLVCAILRPYEAGQGQVERVRVSGPEVALGEHATNSVALVLHELASNAAKYGALSRDGGAVEISWTVDEGDMLVRWTERGGPLVSGAPLATGFGSRLMTETVERALGGTQRRDWLPEGVEVSLRLPLEKLKA